MRSLIMFLAAATALFADDGDRLLTVNHYVRVKSAVPAIEGQTDLRA